MGGESRTPLMIIIINYIYIALHPAITSSKSCTHFDTQITNKIIWNKIIAKISKHIYI